MSGLKYKHIHILGASGSGTTTLAKNLCAHLSYQHLDSDDFFWKTKYSETHPREVRLETLKAELEKHEQWILSGAVIDWGNPLIPLFDLVIFLSVSNELRLKRLYDREYKRYGTAITPSGKRHSDFLDFMNWSDRYETGGLEVRSRHQQEAWLNDLPCDVIEVNNDNHQDEVYQLILETL